MRITLTIPHKRDLGCGSVSFESVTATAEVDLSSESVCFLSVASDGRPLSAWEREDIVASLGVLREALLDRATEIRSDLVKATTAESAECGRIPCGECGCEQSQALEARIDVLEHQLTAWRTALSKALVRSRAIDEGAEPMGADPRGRRDYAYGYLQGVVGAFADGNVPLPREPEPRSPR